MSEPDYGYIDIESCFEPIFELGGDFYIIFGGCINVSSELFGFANQGKQLFFAVTMVIGEVVGLEQIKSAVLQGTIKF